MSPITRSILDEYKTTHTIYKDYCEYLSSALEDLLKKGDYKYHIKYRIKTQKSLLEKIERKLKDGIEYKHVDDIEDIVGIRIVFYTEADRKKFLRYLKKWFGKTSVISEVNGKHGYSSTHLIGKFGEKKSKLSGHEQYKNLKCEIQLTLILEHVWAEAEHDVLYKTSTDIKKRNTSYFENLELRMENIMSQYIKKASKELEEISLEIKKISNQRK